MGRNLFFGRRTFRNTLFISACKIPRHQLLSAEIIQVKAHPGSSDQSDLIDACKNHYMALAKGGRCLAQAYWAAFEAAAGLAQD